LRLEQVIAEVRPRNSWEAIDMGLLLARPPFFRLWVLWSISALPILVGANLFCPPSVAGFAIWWFKPFYELAPLFLISRELFGSSPGWKTIFRRFPWVSVPYLLSALTIRRFSLSRSFNQPVALLEGLQGKAFRERLAVLHLGRQHASWLTIVMAHFEMSLVFGLLAFVLMLSPNSEQALISLPDLFHGNSSFWFWFYQVGSVAALSMVGPFYVCAGFALYLARRTDLEGWDIELEFRRLRQRQETERNRRVLKVGLLVIGISLLLWRGVAVAGEARVQAFTTLDEAQATIDSVMSRDEFGKTERVHHWRYQGDEAPGTVPPWIRRWRRWLDQRFSAIAFVVKAILWGGIGGLVVLGLMRLRHLDRQPSPAGNMNLTSRPIEKPGRDETNRKTDTLPTNLPNAIRDLLQQQQIRAAASLLYRAVIRDFGHATTIPGSATEQECLVLIMRHRSAMEVDFFANLATTWSGIAYGNAAPSPSVVEALCARWQALGQPVG